MGDNSLQLESYYFRKASFEATVKRPTGGGAFDLEVSAICAPHKTDATRFQVVLNARFGPSEDEVKAGYDGAVEVVGRFTAKDIPSDIDATAFVRVKGAAFLMGMAREMVATMTGRGPWPKIMLPNIDFDDPPDREDVATPEEIKMFAGEG